jgi:pimeloyl-ACP methyl ester carboxylesterase
LSTPEILAQLSRALRELLGKIKHPVLTMHTVIDPLVVVAQGHEYAETVANAGRGRLLKQVYTNGNGHCNFTGPQLLTAVGAIRSWSKQELSRPTVHSPRQQASFPASFPADEPAVR